MFKIQQSKKQKRQLLRKLRITVTVTIPEVQTHQRWESVELEMDSSNISTWWSNEFNIEKDMVTVPNKSLGKSDILYREYDRPEVGKALAESHCIEMLRHHHGITNIDAPLEKQRLHKEKGLVTLRRRRKN